MFQGALPPPQEETPRCEPLRLEARSREARFPECCESQGCCATASPGDSLRWRASKYHRLCASESREQRWGRDWHLAVAAGQWRQKLHQDSHHHCAVPQTPPPIREAELRLTRNPYGLPENVSPGQGRRSECERGQADLPHPRLGPARQLWFLRAVGKQPGTCQCCRAESFPSGGLDWQSEPTVLGAFLRVGRSAE